MLPFRSGRTAIVGASFAFLFLLFDAGKIAAADKSGTKKKTAAESEESGLTSIPLPIGHVAKGLTLPDFDLAGHLTGRLQAGTAKRIDLEHVQLTSLKVTTFTPENQVDLVIDMSDSILNLRTKMLSSEKRTTIWRSDFTIAGDTVKFDTVSRETAMAGNVKMILTSNRSRLSGTEAK